MKRARTTIAACGTLLLLAILPTLVAAQVDRHEEVAVSLRGGATIVRDDGADSGPLLGAAISYTASNGIGAFVSYDRSSIEGEYEYTFRQLDGGVRLVLLQDAPVNAVIHAAYTSRVALWEDRPYQGIVKPLRIAGRGITVGAGMQYRLLSLFVLHADASWSGGDMDSITFDNARFRDDGLAIEGSSYRLRAGVGIILLQR